MSTLQNYAHVHKLEALATSAETIAQQDIIHASCSLNKQQLIQNMATSMAATTTSNYCHSQMLQQLERGVFTPSLAVGSIDLLSSTNRNANSQLKQL